MALIPDDPSGYQRLIAEEDQRSLRALLAFEVAAIIGLMLWFSRWSVYVWSFALFIQLAFAVASSYVRTRSLGYALLADRGRAAILETLIAFAVITAFVLIQSPFGLWFAQEPFCSRYCRG